MDYYGELAKQGIGYLIAVIVGIAYYFKDQQVKDLQDKRVSDLIQVKDSYVATVRDLLNAVANLQKSVDSITGIMEAMRWKDK